jgi:hypothetical protein
VPVPHMREEAGVRVVGDPGALAAEVDGVCGQLLGQPLQQPGAWHAEVRMTIALACGGPDGVHPEEQFALGTALFECIDGPTHSVE